MKDNISIKKINSTDIQEISLIHIASFKKSLLTHLGINIVKQYYEWQLMSSDKVYPYGVFLNQKLVGYCFGGSFRVALGGFLLRNKNVICYSLIKRPWVLLKPIFIKKIIKGITVLVRFMKIKKNEEETLLSKKRKNFGILAIATNPDFRGEGFGKILMKYSEKIAQKKSYNKIQLSVSPKNVNAINFYLNLGYKKVNHSREDLWDGNMEKTID